VTAISICLGETYAPVLLEAKAKKLRKKTGDEGYQSIYVTNVNLRRRAIFKRSIIRPLKLFFMSPIVFLLSLHMAVVYGYLFILITTFTTVFENLYQFHAGSAGLSFLGIGVGCIVGVLALGIASDKIFVTMVKNNNGIGKPEYRLPLMIFCSLFIPVGLLIYGWTAENRLHWIIPIIGTAITAIGVVSVLVRRSSLLSYLYPQDLLSPTFPISAVPTAYKIYTCTNEFPLPQLPVQSYLIDAFTRYAASAIAAATILRSVAGGLLPLAGQPMYERLGIGWGNNILGFVALAMSMIPWVFWKYGERIRTRYPIVLE
jgi:hypothetical protein